MNHSKSRVRRGNVLVFVVLILVGLIGIMALAVDMGYLYVVRAKLQATAEASALAGASALGLNETTVRQRALDYAAKNTVGGTPVALQDQDIQLGQWNYAARTFNPTAGTNLTPNAVHVTAQLAKSRNNAVGLFFAPILGINTADVGASATAVFGSRDIVLVLDYSASMNDDSSISQSSGGGRTSSSIPKLGRTAVENQIQLMYQQLGSPTYGKLTFTPQASKTGNPLIEFGLSGVKYPYPSGSWSDYINYVAGYPSGTTYDPYRNKFGYLTLIDYWQAAWPSHNQTPDLWKASEEPVASVKDGVTVFLAFMNQQPTDDRIGFVSYTYTDFRAHLEVSLTTDFTSIQTRSQQMQAGHYTPSTNIAAGLEAARNELKTNGRATAAKVIVLLTDGIANLPLNGGGGGENPSVGIADAKTQANLALKDGFPIITIGLGIDADVQTLQYIANKTNGVFFQVPGGKNVNDFRQQLFDVFAQIAGYQPLLLVD